MKYILLLHLLCAFAAHAQDSSLRTESATGKYKNGIIITENGLKVSQAILLDSTEAEIGNDNRVALGEDVLCRLLISGWKEIDGRVKIGLSQTIETLSGEIILEEEDLLSTLESASLEDAGTVTARAAITELSAPIDDFIVKIKVWDKISKANVKGQYTFHLKKEERKDQTIETVISEGISNNKIIVDGVGLQVTKAVLLHADGSPLSESHTVALGEDVLCRLFISGWHHQGGRVKMGAAQSIKTVDGTVILAQDDLFSGIESMSLEEAGVITLRTSNTELGKSIRDFVVVFKVWDKISGADVKGEYTFHVKWD